MEEFSARLAIIIYRRMAQERDIAACAKAAAVGMIDNHTLHRSIVAPGQQCLSHRMHHGQGQRVQRRWPVQAYETRMALYPNQNIIGHWRKRSRPMIIRIT